MDPVRAEHLELLIAAREPPCVSLFLPTHRTLRARKQDPIRLKNLLASAEQALIDRGSRRADAELLLTKPRHLITETAWWEHNAAGWAIFCSPTVMISLESAVAFDELAVVGRRFHVVPLLPLIAEPCSYRVLAVSQNRVRLFEGNAYQVVELDNDWLPENLRSALHLQPPEGVHQHHTVAHSLKRKKEAVFHGQGGEADEAKEELLMFFRDIDRALTGHLRSKQPPLIFAGVDYLFPIYRQANSYPHLLEQHVSGNPDLVSAAQIYQQAWPLVKPLAQREGRELEARHQRLVGSSRLNCDLREAIFLAHEGRIASLLVAARAQRWGRFDLERRTVQFDEGPYAGNEELVNLCAVTVLAHRGQVIGIDRAHLHDSEVISAEVRAG